MGCDPTMPFKDVIFPLFEQNIQHLQLRGGDVHFGSWL